MGYKRLTREERYQISVLLKSGSSIRQIARLLDRYPSSISRELKRNAGLTEYLPNSADRLAKERRTGISPPRRIQGALEGLVLEKLDQQWSPEQISGRFKLNGIIIAHETIYKYIYKQKKLGNILYFNLRYKRKRRWTQRGRKAMKKKGAQYGQVLIDHRPKIVDKRKRLGDFERDTIRGSIQGPRILTIVDRVSRLTKIGMTEKLSAELTHLETVKLLQRLQVETITNDNGQEFAAHKKTAKSLKTRVYFNHPYCSHERGTNENTNGLIRHYIPKGSKLENVTIEQLKEIERRLNNRPRKTLGYLTPNEVQNG